MSVMVTNKHLLESEWNSDKNRRPFSEVKPYSKNKAWWKCKNGHSWEARIDSRFAGNGCPFCSGRNATSENNLSILNAEVASEWDIEKNHPLTPDIIKSGSHKKVWWRCKNGHQWIAVVHSRTGKNRNGCPFCSKSNRISKIELRIFSELKTIFKGVEHSAIIDNKECDIFIKDHNLVIEFDGQHWHKGKEKRDLEKTSALSQKGITTIRIREKPLLALTRYDIVVNTNESEEVVVKLLIEKIQELYKIDLKEYLAKTGFLNENDYLNLVSEMMFPRIDQSLFGKLPEITNIWDRVKNGKLTPEKIKASSHLKVWCKCEHGHSWKSSAYNLKSGKQCPFCAGQKVCKENSLLELFPEIALQLHPTKNGLKADQITKFSGKKLWWICKEGHEWEEVVKNRTKQRTGCPFCSGRRKNVMSEMGANGFVPEASQKKAKKKD